MALTPLRRGVPVKGMNTVVPIRDMAQEFAPVIENAWFEDGIQLKRRPAFVVNNSGTDASAITAGGIFEHGSNPPILFESYITSAHNVVDKDGTAPSTTFASTTAKLRMATMKGTSIWGNGVDAPQIFDGTSWSTTITLPSVPASTVLGNIFTVFKGRCWAAGDPAYPMTVFFSDAASSSGVTYWDSVASSGKQGGFLDISGDLSVPDTITGLATHRDFLVVFCERHILFYQVTDPIAAGGIAIYKVVDGEGCVNHNTIQGVGEDVLFLSHSGFKSLTKSLIQGDSQVNDISQPINNRVKTVLRGMATTDINNICATYNAKYGLYLCNLPGVESWAYQVQFNAWMRWYVPYDTVYTDSNLTTWMLGAATLGGTNYYGLLTLDTSLYQDKDFDNSLSNISMSWKPSPFRANEVETKNRWNKTEFVYECGASDSVTMEVYLDDEVTPLISSVISLSPSIDLGGGRFTDKEEWPLYGRSELVSIKLTNNSNSDFRLNLIEMYYNPGGIR